MINYTSQEPCQLVRPSALGTTSVLWLEDIFQCYGPSLFTYSRGAEHMDCRLDLASTGLEFDLQASSSVLLYSPRPLFPHSLRLPQ